VNDLGNDVYSTLLTCLWITAVDIQVVKLPSKLPYCADSVQNEAALTVMGQNFHGQCCPEPKQPYFIQWPAVWL
jgi:hypothetical protein